MCMKGVHNHLWSYPVRIWCQNDVVSTSMRRGNVASTLIRCHFYVMCPLGMCCGARKPKQFGPLVLRKCDRSSAYHFLDCSAAACEQSEQGLYWVKTVSCQDYQEKVELLPLTTFTFVCNSDASGVNYHRF